MHPDLIEIGWTEEQWNRIVTTVTEEAQKARVATQLLSVSGPEEPKTVAVPRFALRVQPNPVIVGTAPVDRLMVESDPDLYLQSIAVNVQLRNREVGDPELKAALVMFRRAANLIVRLEDALVFQGRKTGNLTPHELGIAPGVAFGVNIADVGVATIEGTIPATGIQGIFPHIKVPRPRRCLTRIVRGIDGQALVSRIIQAIEALEERMRLGPFACVLGHELFAALCDPTPSMVLPRDRILPFLQGPLLRSSVVPPDFGAVISLSGSPLEMVVATDLNVRFLQTTLEPRFAFRVSERVALRIEDELAIQVLASGESSSEEKSVVPRTNGPRIENYVEDAFFKDEKKTEATSLATTDPSRGDRASQNPRKQTSNPPHSNTGG
jgi:uncharacterized linocin/CFP29 family protein